MNEVSGDPSTHTATGEPRTRPAPADWLAAVVTAAVSVLTWTVIMGLLSAVVFHNPYTWADASGYACLGVLFAGYTSRARPGGTVPGWTLIGLALCGYGLAVVATYVAGAGAGATDLVWWRLLIAVVPALGGVWALRRASRHARTLPPPTDPADPAA